MDDIDSAEVTPGNDNQESSVDILATLADSINFASWQNSVPLLHSLEIQNGYLDDLNNLELRLSSNPPFARSKTWLLDRVTAGTTLSISKRDIELDAEYLNGLNEAELGQVQLGLYRGDELLSSRTHNLRMLARDEWGGMNDMGELLAAFIMPNDPAIAKILKSAGEVLAKHGHSPSLDGYQSRDPRRAYMLVAAIWSAVASLKLTYANPPVSFERTGQKIRRPSTVSGDGLATCLDSTVLFAAAIEAVGLNAVVVMQEGHCFVGAWLIEKSFSRLIERQCSELRKAIVAKELVVFESTLITERPAAPFKTAVSTAQSQTHENEEHKFIGAIDIARARMAQIRPLASHERITNSVDASEEEAISLSLPASPGPEELPSETVEQKPTTAAGRIDRWQRKLLDLSLRNRLLNFKDTRQTVQFICPDISLLEDHLADGIQLRVVSAVDESSIQDRDESLHFQRTKQDIATEFARSALQRKEIASSLAGKELTGRLVELHRKVKNDFAEGGTNTLFLAVGFLRWKRNADDSTSYRAPLLLIPVTLVRKSAISPFYLKHHEDDVRFNATLIQLLKKDFARDISHFERELPADEHGVDVPRVLQQMRHEVRDIPGFEVIDETALSTFSFAKYLMWKDLVDRIGQLENNRVVRHLINDPDKPFASGCDSTIPLGTDIDTQYAPQQLVHPLPADSSQLAAVMAAAEGHDFVLIGPPGTGKSQTIANMIAQCLARKKTVLFVAEKTAALNVVHRRLREHGLDDLCVELHSNKAERRRFLDQLKTSWDRGQTTTESDWVTVSSRLKVKRDELNSYVCELHAEDESGWSVYRAMGISVKGQMAACVDLDWPRSLRLNKQKYDALADLVNELARTYARIDPAIQLKIEMADDWSAGWEMRFLQAATKLQEATLVLRSALKTFLETFSVEKDDCSAEDLQAFLQLGDVLLETARENYRLVFHKQLAELQSAVEVLEDDVKILVAASQGAKAAFEIEVVPTIPLDDLELNWRKANAKYWPFSVFSRRRVRKSLQQFATLGETDPQIDLPQLRRMRELLGKIESNSLAGQTAYWQNTETDIPALRRHLRHANAVRRAILTVGKSIGSVPEFSRAIGPYLVNSVDREPLFEKIRNLKRVTEDFTTAIASYRELAACEPYSRGSKVILSESLSSAQTILKHRNALQLWVTWSSVRKRAISHGLGAIVAGLESNQISSNNAPDVFELAYARWWLPGAIDSSRVLCTFQKFRHEDAILDFRQLDSLARESASLYVREIVDHQLPAPDTVPRKSELGHLRHQMQLRRPSKTIREVISDMPDTFGKLAPCVMMSPLSIAQYLPASQALFDLVIFDEASQITTWDAIGAIARGRQTIIVGDPKQLPPSNFFGRADNDDDEELEDNESDLESILDECQASGLPTLRLNWHYRSRHESLISFSNWHYYGNGLVTFPSAVTNDQAVSLKYLPHSEYDRGKSCTNRIEAQAIVDEAVSRMKSALSLKETERPTLGVITFNSQQQTLIQDLFDQALRDNPELEWYFDDARIEPTVVKNLENVQGDERDVMFFSITFGPDKAGKLALTFGALNREGGHRRLNVAVTRSRQELIVYSAFKADQLNADRTKAQGVRDLKNFLDYADRGPVALAAETSGSAGGFDSPFEEAVANALEDCGWQVVPQVGVSGFRVDLGIIHPEKPGVYLAGIECDGATYHRSAMARDRDLTREQILINLGWNIIRVWSPDWWYDKDSAIEQIDLSLKELLNAEVVAPEATPEDTQCDKDEATMCFAAAPLSKEKAPVFRRAQLDTFDTDPALFYDEVSTEMLKAMIYTTIQAEAPIREDILYRRIARAYGWMRTGQKIRQRLEMLLPEVAISNESVGRFFWSSDQAGDMIEFRYPDTNDDVRSIDEISIAELCGLALKDSDALLTDDPIGDLARRMGILRVTKSARDRLEEALEASKRISDSTKMAQKTV